jgi:DNA-binding transcriptional MocR family regulator
VIIVEDEPYWNLQFPSAYEKTVHYRGSSPEPNLYTKNYNAEGKSSGYAFLDSLVPSYLSIDTEGRVVRLDTFSKTIAPGSRLGWITAQPAFIERFARITEVTTQQPSGFVQSLVAEMIFGKSEEDNTVRSKQVSSGWHMDGWVRWLEGLRGSYEKRMQAMCTVLEENKYLFHEGSTVDPVDDWEVVDRVQMFDFVWPIGGMFTWIEIFFDTHPLRSQFSGERLSKAFWIHLTKKPYLCLVGPGSMFAATPTSAEKAYRYIRVAFAPMDIDAVAPFTHRLVAGLRSFWQLKNLDGLSGDEEAEVAIEALQLGPGVNFLGTGC